jgi:serine phosphatase RsbU (regulator of sigma subunit)
MAFHYIPGETISGDFLDYAKDSLGRTVFLISDVSGHGYSAGLIASMVKIAFQSTVKETANGSEQMGKINNMLYGHIHHNFVTASSLRIDLEKKEAEFVCCGHFPLIQYNRNTKQLKQHKPAGIPLGVTSNSRFEGVKISLEPGNRFVLYTDGLIEETNQIDEEFGADRLFEEIRAKGHFNTSQFSGYLKDTIQQWNFGKIREDDIAFIVIDID